MLSRRDFIVVGAAAGLAPGAALAAPGANGSGAIKPGLLRAALRSYQNHKNRLGYHDYIGIADFSVASRLPRFHILDLASGRARALLVAHGRGSDPDHSGWVEKFSNEPGSAASSRGAYLTQDIYQGKHGCSRRLVGLDPQNSNAEPRAIVIHSAWYVGPQMIRDHGKLGRSEGCFAFSDDDLSMVLDRLGPGRFIYADKLGKA